MPRPRRNLISRLMSLLIAHPSPRRLFIGADRDRPMAPSSPYRFSLANNPPYRFLLFERLQRLREEERERERKNIDPLDERKGRRRFRGSARFIRGEKSRRGHVSRVPLVSLHHALVYFPPTNLRFLQHPRARPRVSISSHE